MTETMIALDQANLSPHFHRTSALVEDMRPSEEDIAHMAVAMQTCSVGPWILKMEELWIVWHAALLSASNEVFGLCVEWYGRLCRLIRMALAYYAQRDAKAAPVFVRIMTTTSASYCVTVMQNQIREMYEQTLSDENFLLKTTNQWFIDNM